MTNKPIKPQPIRNGRIKRDFKRLLAIIADTAEPDYAEVEAIAKRNGLVFDEGGAVKETRNLAVNKGICPFPTKCNKRFTCTKNYCNHDNCVNGHTFRRS